MSSFSSSSVALLVVIFSHPRTPQSLVSDMVGFGKPEVLSAKDRRSVGVEVGELRLCP